MHSQGTGPPKLLLWLVVAAVLVSACSALNQDPWQVLGVRRSATKGEITRAFRRLSREWHPDKNRSPEATQKFQEISAAYDLLTDSNKTKTLWETIDTSPPGSAFTATFGTVQYVLDLDPVRLKDLLTTWAVDWGRKNWETIGPMWQSPVEQSVCWCMENAWRLPKLTEPASKLLASVLGTKHREGAWRGWRLSGALLEFSAWSSRQLPCLQHHVAGSSSTEQDTLAQLQQQLHIRRKARQAAVEAAQRRQKRKDATSGSNRDSAEGFAHQHLKGAGEAVGSSWQGRVVWVTVLLLVGQWCVFQRKGLVIAPITAAAAVVYGVSRGLLLPDEAAVQQLAAVFDANQGPAVAIGVGCVLLSMAIGLLLPLLLLSAAFVAVTWVWAAASTLALASTPAMSQAGLALWMLAQLYFLTGGGDPLKSVVVIGFAVYVCWKVPKLFFYWLSLITAPVVLVLAFVRETLRGCGLWWQAPKVAPAAAAAAAQQAAAERAAAATAHPADPQADVPEYMSPSSNGHQQQQQQQRRQRQEEQQPMPKENGRLQNGAAASPDAVAAGVAAGGGGPVWGSKNSRNRGNSSSSSSKKGVMQRLLPAGPWWPKSFGPVQPCCDVSLVHNPTWLALGNLGGGSCQHQLQADRAISTTCSCLSSVWRSHQAADVTECSPAAAVARRTGSWAAVEAAAAAGTAAMKQRPQQFCAQGLVWQPYDNRARVCRCCDCRCCDCRERLCDPEWPWLQAAACAQR